MRDLTIMSDKELKRAEIVPLVTQKRKTQKQAGYELNLSTRQIRRLCVQCRELGLKGLNSKRRGRASNCRLSQSTIKQAVERIQQRYPDFGPTLAHEKLTEEDGSKISLSSARKIIDNSLTQ
jgi:transposase